MSYQPKLLPVYVKKSLQQNDILENIVQVSCGKEYTIFLENTGRVLGCGRNEYGQLGIGNNERTNLPTYVQKSLTPNDILENIVQISSSGIYTMFLETTGRVLGCGDNNYGQLGIGINEAKNLPVYVQKSLTSNDVLENIVQISAGGYHVAFLENTGRVLGCGWNNNDQLGIGNYDSVNLPITLSVGNNDTFYEKKSYIEYPLSSYNSTKANRSIIQVSCGAWCSFFLENTGKVLVSGYNSYNSLGIAENTALVTFPKYVRNSDNTGYLNNIISITTGPFSTFFFKNSGNLLACGKNNKGELGIGNNNITIYPQYVRNSENNGNLSNIIQIATSWDTNNSSHTLFLENTGKVLGCGANWAGQLGIGNYDDKNLPVYVRNANNTEELHNITQISIGTHSMFLDIDNHVLACGNNYSGMLGFGVNYTNLNNSNLPSYVRNVYNNGILENILQISAGVYNTLFLENTGQVLGCGANWAGQLGIGNYDDKNLPVYVRNANNTDNISNIVQVLSSYYDDSFLLENTGKVLAFGENYSGELGIASALKNITQPTYVKNVDGLTDLTNIVKIHTGIDNTIFINDENNFLIAGSYADREFDIYNIYYDPINTPRYIKIFDVDTDTSNMLCSYLDTTLIINSSNNVVCNGYNYNNMFGNLSINKCITDAYSEGVLNNVVSVAVGSSHCILKDVLHVYACGNNTYGQLGTGNFKKYFKPIALSTNNVYINKIACGAYHSLIASDAKCFASGLNNYGQLGLGNNNNYNVMTEITTPQLTFKSIKCGEYHSVFLNSANTVYSCGLNNYGQLGIGNIVNQNVPTQIVSANLYSEVTKIACSKNNTIFLTKIHKVWICGNNNKYQLANKYMQYNMYPITNTFYENVLDIYSNLFIDKIYIKYLL
jgi:alpha-tubulin suppressor-like RCC1 family protein